MRVTTSVVVLGSLASAVAAAAAAAGSFQFPESVPLHSRQTQGPSYQCHANCGYAIQNSVREGYCNDDAWLDLLDGCLDCALEYNIWQHYGNKVGAAAEKCGLDASPRQPGNGQSSAAPTSAAPATTVTGTSSAVVVQPTTATGASSAVIVQPTTATGASSAVVVQPTTAVSSALRPSPPSFSPTKVSTIAGSGVTTSASAPVTRIGHGNTCAFQLRYCIGGKIARH
ncbi:hypothetical protein RJ55_00968 [Drechmeria coniospora]|nr:hypothetical protein RJ55_00968 [Drechmeria coniospora]